MYLAHDRRMIDEIERLNLFEAISVLKRLDLFCMKLGVILTEDFDGHRTQVDSEQVFSGKSETFENRQLSAGRASDVENFGARFIQT